MANYKNRSNLTSVEIFEIIKQITSLLGQDWHYVEPSKNDVRCNIQSKNNRRINFDTVKKSGYLVIRAMIPGDNNRDIRGSLNYDTVHKQMTVNLNRTAESIARSIKNSVLAGYDQAAEAARNNLIEKKKKTDAIIEEKQSIKNCFLKYFDFKTCGSSGYEWPNIFPLASRTNAIKIEQTYRGFSVNVRDLSADQAIELVAFLKKLSIQE
jgi:hypothetical protein